MNYFRLFVKTMKCQTVPLVAAGDPMVFGENKLARAHLF